VLQNLEVFYCKYSLILKGSKKIIILHPLGARIFSDIELHLYMVRSLFLLGLFPILFFSCRPATQERGQSREDMIMRIEALESSLAEAERAFLDNLAELCGKSFRGKETYSAPGRESWANRSLIMHVLVCEQDSVHIPFHVDQDRSRTWKFIAEENGLRFRHDHRHADGTPEAVTLYGGYADGTGTEYMQKFPADKYTVDLLEDVLGREWRVILARDLSSMTYELHYSGKLMFAAEFDLRDPV
jgi:hypothetical protein